MGTDERQAPIDDERSFLMMLARARIHPGLQQKVDASDLVQQTLLEAHQGEAAFRGETRAERLAWLRRILTRNVANAVRDLRRAKRDVGRERSLDDSAAELGAWLRADEASPLERAVQADQLVGVSRAFQRLPEPNQQALALRYWRGWSLARIGESLGRSPAAVAGLSHRGLRQLREENPE
jgi:RNA polymerase sigma-70 factor (ECF subfamily)